MCRFIAILLLVLLPLQASWAGAAAYCQHETSNVAKNHFGHHEHVHKTDSDQSPKKQVHGDCAVCHIIAFQAVPSNTQSLPEKPVVLEDFSAPSLLLLSSFASVPDRPQWHRLA